MLRIASEIRQHQEIEPGEQHLWPTTQSNLVRTSRDIKLRKERQLLGTEMRNVALSFWFLTMRQVRERERERETHKYLKKNYNDKISK